RGGFWRAQQWVRLERVQFVGACNPPTDPGRVALSRRFLRHAPLVLVDYPGAAALRQIYGVLARAMLKVQPQLRAHAGALTGAMVDVYAASQRRFTADQQAHYVYSPRELTRWMRGMHEALAPLEALSVEGLVRLWAHEALRLFQDRLVAPAERAWTDAAIDAAARAHFPAADLGAALARPILFSNWLTRHYAPVAREELRDYMRARLRVFCEEELDVPLVLFNDVLDHVLRIDRVFRQPQGHALLIGVSGAGKTTLARFAAWMNGLAVVQVRAHRGYGAADFDADLRAVLRRSGCGGERVCFILDESNVLDAGFLERMNTLLASSEVPGLFEGDDLAALLTACREGAQRDGLLLDAPDELFRWFTQQVARNLHVVFTMNPPAAGLAQRAATSPALFNRCVLDWFGDWSDQALFQVARELTLRVDLDRAGFAAPDTLPVAYAGLELPASHRDAVANACVAAHQAVRVANARLRRRRGAVVHVTPRHYLDFLQHLQRLYFARRDALEEQQRHVNVGLDKLQRTVAQVSELRAALRTTQQQLRAKTAEADAKLRQMVQDQQEAERQQQAAAALQAELAQSEAAIGTRRAEVVRDLERAEPAVADAQRAVSNIKKQHLTEVRAMANPPAAVKLAMDGVCTLLGHRAPDWKALQGVIRRDDFIASIVRFDTDAQLTRPLRALMRRQFLALPEFNFESVSRASKACGPLVKWVVAQVEYAEILERVGPLRAEVARLEQDAADTQARAGALQQTVRELEAAIAGYKDEYALLIAETERLKAEMARVEAKVARSVGLLASLESERARWEQGSLRFDAQMATLVGDALQAAALLAYGGLYDQRYRGLLAARWALQAERSGIRVGDDARAADFLATAEQRLAWQALGLPDDALAMENAAMLESFNRYPLLIDPSGAAARFLELRAEQQGRKLTVTSFLDPAFLKHLEAALRFGNPILVHDVEHVDPILNPVLNRELRRTGGRVLVRLGAQDIDFSPSFALFLATRDPAAVFAPDLASRVTFVNFTVTRASLQAQCLAQVMRHERPDVDARRRDLVRLQGEFRLRLHALEKELLRALNASQGSILDDDAVVATLETLKLEAAEVARKAAETDGVMREVDQIAQSFTPLARACSAVYFALDRLAALHPFYQFSLDFFNRIFRDAVERNANLDGIADERLRLRILRRDLFALAFRRAAVSLHHDKQLALLVQLAQIKLRGDEESEDGDAGPSQEAWARLNADLDFVMRDALLAAPSAPADADVATELAATRVAGVAASADARTALAALAQQLPWCRAWVRELGAESGSGADEWAAFAASDEPERCVPSAALLADGDALSGLPAALALRTLIVVRALRPERVLAAAARFASAVFEGAMGDALGARMDDAGLAHIVADEADAATPVALCSVPGHDAAYRVDALAREQQRGVHAVAMGSVEGFALADQAIAAAAKSGAWVLLKNVHLAPTWLGQLEKRLQTLRAHDQFRLFLTTEINPAVPASLLRRARTLVFEPAPGIRANLLESLASIKNTAGPAELARLHFLLAWLHSVAVERLRYAPLGWSSAYEFSDADFACALATVDCWVARAAHGRANIDPARIPWDAIRTLLAESVYGGRIDSDFDHAVLRSFVARWFCADAYGADFDLCDGVRAPEGIAPRDFVRWCEQLPEHEPPTWLGLPPNAETLLLVHKGRELVADVRRLRSLMDDDDGDDDDEGEEPAPNAASAATADADHAELPAFMRQVELLAAGFAAALPAAALPPLSAAPDAADTPLFRVVEREHSVAQTLLAQVRRDLEQLRRVCRGECKQTNHLRQLLADFNAGVVPQSWLVYTVPRGLALSRWIADFVQRLSQTQALAQSALDPQARIDVWLGGLLFPEAFITATRQMAAKQLACSLEELQIALVREPAGVAVSGLKLEGAVWSDSVQLNDGRAEPLDSCYLQWSKDACQDGVVVPVYLNGDRSLLLFQTSVPVGPSTDKQQVVQRAVAITAA
ncbi:dynein heavy chain, partial [Coemansia sp. RSA 2610]